MPRAEDGPQTGGAAYTFALIEKVRWPAAVAGFFTLALAFAPATVATNARAANLPLPYPTKAEPSTPPACTSHQDFRDTDCSLTLYGITLYGTYDVGVGYVTHGTPENGSPFQVRSATVRHRRHGGVIGGRKGRGQGL